MIEQLTLFEEHLDLLTIVTRWLVRRYEKRKEFFGDGFKENFNDWLLYMFSHYNGGTVNDDEMERSGYVFFDCSPKGIKLDTRGRNFGFLPKAKVLKAFGIKDDKEDVIRNETD